MSEPAISHWQALGQLIRPQRRAYAGLAVVMGCAASLPVLTPLLVRRIIDTTVAGDATTASITTLAVVFLAMAIASQIATVVVSYYATTIAWKTANGLRTQLAAHVLGLGHGFHRDHSPGELIQRIDGDVTSVSDFLGRVLLKTGGAFLLLVGMFMVLTVLDWRIGLAFAIYLFLASRIAVRQRNKSVNEAVHEMSVKARLYGGIEERLVASEDLRANGAGPHAMWRFVQDATVGLDAATDMERAFLRLWWNMRTLLLGGLVLSLVASAALIDRDIITIGTAFVLFQYSLVIGRPLEDIVDQFDTVQKANGAMVRVVELLAMKPSIADTGTTSPAEGPLAVSFNDVGFDYGDDEPVLRHINLAIEPGQSVGVVGRSGSGKTTLSRLVLRLVEAGSGTVALGDVPIGNISQHELRRRVALIPQDVQLIGGTVRDNVTFFDHSWSDAEVAAALSEVGLDHLANSLDSLLGDASAVEDAIGLSAGEAQLLAMARAWLRQPDVVVLDEATSRVDPETEEQLQHAIGRLLDGRTSIVIAHRLSTLRSVDRIVVMADGAIIEDGDRATLVADPTSEFRRLMDLALEETA